MAIKTKRLTTAQATILFLQNQYIERDGKEQVFFGGCFGIFGHGNVAGIGQALQQYPSFKYYQSRNEQAMVHTAISYAKTKDRLGAFVCTTSIGPGATNMITGAATATINRIPVLLLPGDIFATRQVAPVLQQLESNLSQDISVNDCFKPVSRYWDRINRPEQLITSLPEAMRVLTSPAETGAVTISLPQDVQAEAYDFPVELFAKRVWHVQRPRPDKQALLKAVALIKKAKKPLIIAGGGVIYSGATAELKKFAAQTGIPVAETFAGKGSLRYDEPQNLGAAGVTGTPGAVACAAAADVVIGIGTRYSDFTTISEAAFQNNAVRFININILEFDAFKHGAVPLTGDAKEILKELISLLRDYKVPLAYNKQVIRFNQQWDRKVSATYRPQPGERITQGEVIGAVNTSSADNDMVVCAAGSLPGDLHKLWRTRNPKGFNMEYGYSCMGYEIAGALGAKMADPDREVYAMVGDGSYLMMSQEIVTAVAEGFKITVILINNNGYASIGGLSESLGTEGFGTGYAYRNKRTGQNDGKLLPVDLAANAASLGATVIRAKDLKALRIALEEAKNIRNTTVIYVETERTKGVPGYAWWEVPVAQISTSKKVKLAYEKLAKNKKRQKYYL
jgi:3D-(3,5/4)-trihydroxycyclohexane-1,2-dione acylhydrolase (decyclizing)